MAGAVLVMGADAGHDASIGPRGRLVHAVWATISAIATVPPISARTTSSLRSEPVNRRHRPSLVLRTNGAESRVLIGGLPSETRAMLHGDHIGPNLPMRSIEANEDSTDARSARDVAKRRWSREAPTMNAE